MTTSLLRRDTGMFSAPTFVAEVVDQDDLGDELWRRAVENAVDRPEQRRPALVVEGDDDAGVGELLCIQLPLAAAKRTQKTRSIHSSGPLHQFRPFSFLFPQRKKKKECVRVS